jgi:heptosyltransferase-2
MNLALFKVNNLGDNIVFLPVVQALRKRFPDWRLMVFTSPAAAELYAGLVPPARLVALSRADFNRGWRKPWQMARWFGKMAAFRSDASLVAPDQGSVAHLLARLAGGGIRAGGAGLTIRLQGTLTHAVPFAANQTIAQWNWEVARALLSALGERDWPAEPPAPDLSSLVGPPPPSAGAPRIVIHAGSSREYQRWPLAAYSELAARLARDFQVVWVLRPDTAATRLAPSVRVVEMHSLRDLVTWLAASDLYVGNNSGPMHLVSSLGLPAIILTGPTHFCWDPFWHRESVRLLRAPGLACLPCDRHDFGADVCQNAANPMACMRYWSVEAVEAACRGQLGRFGSRGRQAALP